MSRNNGKKGNGQPDKSDNAARTGNRPVLTWRNGELSAEDKAWLRDNHNGLLSLLADFLNALPDTETFSVKFDERSSRYLATLVCNAGHKYSPNVALGVRGKTHAHALFGLAYLYQVRYMGDLGGSDADDDTDDWG